MEPSSSSSQNPLLTPNSSVIQQDSPSPLLSAASKNPEDQEGSSSRVVVEWSSEEIKVFEDTLAEVGSGDEELSELLLPSLALRIPTKTISQLEKRLEELEDDVKMIESLGFDEIINLLKSDTEDNPSQEEASSSKKKKNDGEEEEEEEEKEEAAPPKKKPRFVPRERRKPIPWTKTEHEMFLVGLEHYGRGNWRNISKHLVPSKKPAQISSHAQKYFLKLKNPKTCLRRDGSFMRTVDDSQMLAAVAKVEQPAAISDDKKNPA